jgi:hypothetical protein
MTKRKAEHPTTTEVAMTKVVTDRVQFYGELVRVLRGSSELEKKWNRLSFLKNDPNDIMEDMMDAFMEAYAPGKEIK